MTVFLFNNNRSLRQFFVASMMLCVAALASCGGSHTSSLSSVGEEEELRHSELLSISKHPGFTEVTVMNPWDTLKTLQRLILIPKDSVMPSELPEGMIIRIPVSNALVYSTIHAALLEELNAGEAIGGMCDVEFITDSLLRKRLEAGTLTDCGLPDNPNIERVISMRPDVIMLSPFEGSQQYSKVASLGIPIVQCADYMETSPLGRAEWIRLYGLLFGVSEKAKKTYGDIESEYISLKQKASKAKQKPKVLTDQRYGQVWNVPCGHSTMGIIIEDAGGVNPFSSYDRSGSVALSPEQVLSKAFDADIWLVRYNQKGEKTLKEIAADSPVNSHFLAYKNGNVYGCNTARSKLFEDTPFHPERLLREMVTLFHPELSDGQEPIYYHKMR